MELTDTVPGLATFLPASSSPGWSCAPGNGAGSTCTLALGSLAPGASAVRTFAVQLAAAFPEQKELAQRGRSALAASAEVYEPLSAPWSDGEQLVLEARLGNMGIGALVLGASADVADGREVWRLETRRLFATVENNMGVSEVLAARDTLAPLASRFRHRLIGDVEATYAPGEVRILPVEEIR